MAGQHLLEVVPVDELTLTDAALALRGRSDRQNGILFWQNQRLRVRLGLEGAAFLTGC